MFLLCYSIKYHFFFTSHTFHLSHFLHLSLSHSSQAHRPCTQFSLQLHPNPLVLLEHSHIALTHKPLLFHSLPLIESRPFRSLPLPPHRPLLYLPPKRHRQEIVLTIIVFVAAINDTVSISSQLNPIRARIET